MALQLSTRGVLTLVDHAVPGQLRAVWLRLRAIDPGVQLVVTAKALFDLPEGSLVLYAPDPAADGVTLNLMRPIVADRRYRIVLWCEDGISEELLRHAPDFFDWITAHVECPWRPMPHALATITAAYRARAPAIVWHGPDLERTLAWLRPGRRVRRISVADYAALVDAMAAQALDWLCVDDVRDEYAAQRVAWAWLEAGRLRPVFAVGAVEVSLGQPWHEVVTIPLKRTMPQGGLWLALRSEPMTAQTVAILHVSDPSKLEADLMQAEDPGPVYALAVEPSPPVSDNSDRIEFAGRPTWMWRREPRPLSSDERDLYDTRCRPWRRLDWLERAVVAAEACHGEIATRWLGRGPPTEDVPPWLFAQLSWDAGALGGAVRSLGDDPSTDGLREAELRAELCDELELAPHSAGGDSSYQHSTGSGTLRDASEGHGRFHRRTIDLHRNRAEQLLQTRELHDAAIELRTAKHLAHRIFPAQHPAIAKVDFCYAVVLALTGALAVAAELATDAARIATAVYPPTHSSHRALARLRAEIDLRRGNAATLDEYTKRVADVDLPTTWWLRPAFSLSYVPPAP